MGLTADGEAWDVRRGAEELQRSGVGPAGRFQLPGVGGEGLGDAGCLSLFIGQQGADVIVVKRGRFSNYFIEKRLRFMLYPLE